MNPLSMGIVNIWQYWLEIDRTKLSNTTNKMKKWEDHTMHDVEFQVGELVLLNLSSDQFPPPKGMDPSLLHRYEGMLKVLEKIGNITYILELSFHMHHLHLVFHII
jgi:hypothetical protein